MTTTLAITCSALLLGLVLLGVSGPAVRPEEEQEPGQPASKSVLKPEDWPGEFTRRVNAGDLEGMVALYASDARFVPPGGGETLVGRDRIRTVLAGLVSAKTQLRSRDSRFSVQQ